MKQHFKVGELVVIECEIDPSVHGQIATILEIDTNTLWEMPSGRINNDTGYRLDKATEYSPWYDITHLRKYYPPSTKTFAEIMQELKNPVAP